LEKKSGTNFETRGKLGETGRREVGIVTITCRKLFTLLRLLLLKKEEISPLSHFHSLVLLLLILVSLAV
jgi:hypothetical protein